MQIDWWTLALQLLNFLVLVWLLQRFLFQPVRRLIETRRAKSDQMLHTAQVKLDEAEAEKARYAELIAAFDARKESDLKDFQKQLDMDREALLSKAREEAEAMMTAVKEEIAQERREAIAASRADIVELAKEIASRILSGRAAEAGPMSDLAAALEKLHGLPDRDRQRLAESIARGGSGIVVVTAAVLDKAQQNDIAQALRKEFGDGLRITFDTDTGLLGGMKIILPNAQLDASWAAYLDAAIERLLEGGDERRV